VNQRVLLVPSVAPRRQRVLLYAPLYLLSLLHYLLSYLKYATPLVYESRTALARPVFQFLKVLVDDGLHGETMLGDLEVQEGA
jgi:hypothetical protein